MADLEIFSSTQPQDMCCSSDTRWLPNNSGTELRVSAGAALLEKPQSFYQASAVTFVVGQMKQRDLPPQGTAEGTLCWYTPVIRWCGSEICISSIETVSIIFATRTRASLLSGGVALRCDKSADAKHHELNFNMSTWSYFIYVTITN